MQYADHDQDYAGSWLATHYRVCSFPSISDDDRGIGAVPANFGMSADDVFHDERKKYAAIRKGTEAGSREQVNYTGEVCLRFKYALLIYAPKELP